ncbi:SDR family NAD(P)-dependent oxidoreductase [Polymorphum gilvum]|uniref:Short-chain dehydrogenase/reductase SDR n=1 Tax=Polymorphum gilvum (strain LMG 25793 / CGMCC 1.9160 / SL003B-26A1) TaxID=991905 RepID=F2J5C8_POLGS|nr:SDR family oxidoreductase [Polymorphum gilvum]ADZ71187.1 Short-chain dehydrogenase/reductase SDR [Polymorphum gilvum SL003B-26A1]
MTNSLFSVENLAVIVTGAARGNGRAIAEGFARHGAQVLAVDRLACEGGAPAGVHPMVADLTEPDAAECIAEAALARFARIDVLVNNAGVSLGGDDPYADEIWRATLAVNLDAPFRLIRRVAAEMAGRGGGAIVNVTSLGAHLGFPGNPAYQASKAALRQLTLAVARDFGARNVRVNNLCPGYIHTDMTRKSHADPALHAERQAHMLLPRWGCSEDLVGPCLFLASPAAAYVTGIDLPVDGGWLAKGL